MCSKGTAGSLEYQDTYLYHVLLSSVGLFPCTMHQSRLNISTPLLVFSLVIWSSILSCSFIIGWMFLNIYFLTAVHLLYAVVSLHLSVHTLTLLTNIFMLPTCNRMLRVLKNVDAILTLISDVRLPQRTRIDRFLEIIFIPIHFINVLQYDHLTGGFLFVGASTIGLIFGHFLAIGSGILRRYRFVVARISLLLEKPRRKNLRNAIILTRIHDQLNHVLEDFYQFSSTKLFILTVFIFFYTLSRLFFFWKLFDYWQIYFYSRLYWVIFYWVSFMRVVDCTSEIERKAKEFNTLLYQLMIEDKTNVISTNKKLRLHISMKREVVFTACGFFNIDYTLIHSIVAAATTYLVILVQLGQQTPEIKKIISSNITTTILPNSTT